MRNDNSNTETGGESLNPYRAIIIVGTTSNGKIATINQHITKLRKYRDRSNDTTES
jgi:hypothetical protein